MFGSVADYANSRFMSTLNNDQGAYQMLKDAANALSKAELGKSAEKLGEAADKWLNSLSRI